MNKEQFIEDFKSEFIDRDEIVMTADTEFREIGSWDSLTGMAILVMIQDNYDKNFSESIFKKCKTVEDVFNSLEKV